MHLILTSRDFLNDNSKNCIISNLKTSVEKCKILFIPNEKATLETIQSEKYYNRVKVHGFKIQNIYIFDYYHPENYTNLDIDANKTHTPINVFHPDDIKLSTQSIIFFQLF